MEVSKAFTFKSNLYTVKNLFIYEMENTTFVSKKKQLILDYIDSLHTEAYSFSYSMPGKIVPVSTPFNRFEDYIIKINLSKLNLSGIDFSNTHFYRPLSGGTKSHIRLPT